MTQSKTIDLSQRDHEAAFSEVAFLVDIFSNTIDSVMGGAIAPVGRVAGRDMARKLPIDVTDRTPSQIVELLSKRMGVGFEFECESVNECDLRICIKRCIIRDICRNRCVEPGGAICRLFHAYLDGVLNELTQRPARSVIAKAGDKCEIETQLR